MPVQLYLCAGRKQENRSSRNLITILLDFLMYQQFKCWYFDHWKSCLIVLSQTRNNLKLSQFIVHLSTMSCVVLSQRAYCKRKIYPFYCQIQDRRIQDTREFIDKKIHNQLKIPLSTCFSWGNRKFKWALESSVPEASFLIGKPTNNNYSCMYQPVIFPAICLYRQL